MDKIICDVCGTSYPDSADQCPICGYVKSTRAKSDVSEDGGYTHVRGGRFSNNNVKRRNEENGIPVAKPEESVRKKAPAAGSNMILGITAVILIIVLLLVVVIFVTKVIGRINSGVNELPSGNVSTAETTAPEKPGPCQELHTNAPAVEIAEEAGSVALQVSTVPAVTTDSITYTSMDPEIATVTASGVVTGVSSGETAIAVRCGDATLLITVNCTFGPDIPADGTWSMNRKDITLSKEGETWDLYSKNSTIAKNLIKWTSDDESVATIEDGIVKAVGRGKTMVRGECNGITYSCTIRCNLPLTDTEKEDENKNEDAATPDENEKTVKISHTDVTLKPNGEANDKSFNLYLKDGDGNKLDVTWTASEEGYVTIEGNKITAIKAGKSITVSATYEGETYKCTIRLK